MNLLSKLNSPEMYLICGAIVLFVAVVCVIFMVRAYRAGKAIGMDVSKMKRTIISSATFAVLPSVGILLGVIALSGSLGTPLPWLRLSVIGALHYETQVAEAAAEAAGLEALSASQMTPTAFSTIALLMTVCIMWGMVFALFTCKKYCEKLTGKPDKAVTDGENGTEKKKSSLAGFGDLAMTAMFIGLVSAYLGSYLGGYVSTAGGLFSFSGDWLPIAVAAVGGLVMAVFLFFRNKFKADWLDGFSIAGSMLVAMASAVLFAGL